MLGVIGEYLWRINESARKRQDDIKEGPVQMYHSLSPASTLPGLPGSRR
jgi:hypothetical protein